MLIPLRLRRAALLAVAASLLLLTSCFDVPLGDPAISKIDPQLLGYWDQQTEDEDGTVVAVAGFDERTYLITFINYSKPAGAEPTFTESHSCKAWLTTIGKAPFLTLQPVTLLPGVSVDRKPAYMHARLDIAPAAITTRGLDPDAPLLKNHPDAASLARAIESNLDDAAIYVTHTQTYRKLDPSRAADSQLIDMAVERKRGE